MAIVLRIIPALRGADKTFLADRPALCGRELQMSLGDSEGVQYNGLRWGIAPRAFGEEVHKVEVTLYRSPALFDELESEWNALLKDSSADCIFLTHQWQSSWWDAYRPGEIWALAVREGAELVGLAPWFVRPEGNGRRVVRAIGCVDVTDYLEVIARRGKERAVFEALARDIATRGADYDDIRLCNAPEASLTVQMLPDVFREQGFAVEVTFQDVCPVINLPDSFEAFLAGLDKKNRHELRRKLRRAASDEVDWYLVTEGCDLNAELEKFLKLMAASSDEKALFLRERENEAFFRGVVPRIAEAGWLHLAFLTIDGEAAAAYLNFDYGNRIMVYNSGHNHSVHAHYSPGIILMARLIEHAIGQGRQELDFLRGDEPYKYDLGGKDTRVFQVAINPAPGA